MGGYFADACRCQFAGCAVAIAGAENFDTVLLGTDGVVLAVTQHDGAGFGAACYVQAAQYFGDNVGLGGQFAVEAGAGNGNEIVGEAKMFQDLFGIKLRLAGSDSKGFICLPQGLQQFWHTAID